MACEQSLRNGRGQSGKRQLRVHAPRRARRERARARWSRTEFSARATFRTAANSSSGHALQRHALTGRFSTIRARGARRRAPRPPPVCRDRACRRELRGHAQSSRIVPVRSANLCIRPPLAPDFPGAREARDRSRREAFARWPESQPEHRPGRADRPPPFRERHSAGAPARAWPMRPASKTATDFPASRRRSQAAAAKPRESRRRRRRNRLPAADVAGAGVKVEFPGRLTPSEDARRGAEDMRRHERLSITDCEIRIDSECRIGGSPM